MGVATRMRRQIRRFRRALAEALMTFGGRDVYLETERIRAEGHFNPGLLHHPVTMAFLSGCDGPPPGHPERLCPEVPLTLQELLLLRGLE